MKKLFATLLILTSLTAAAAVFAWTHGPLPTSSGLTPSASWNGTLLSGFAGGIAPPSPTMTITGVAAGGAESTCASTCIQLTIADTTRFGTTSATGLACAKYVQGAGEANGCWPYYVVSATQLDLLGSTYANGTLYVANSGGAPALVGVAYGAQTITAVASGSSGECGGTAGCPKLTVASTANMTTDDSFSIFNLGTMSGLWPIQVLDATHLVLGTPNQPAPPYDAFSPTSTSIIANNQLVIGTMDEHSGKVWETGNEYITYGAVINNRNAIANVTCYFENSSGAITTTQSANPNHPDDGYVLQLNPGAVASHANGQASLFCDAIPVNGLARRQALNIWINSATADSSYVNRATGIGTMYVDTSTATADSGACPGAGGKGTSPSNPYSTIVYATVCGRSQLAGTVSASTGGYIVQVANNILNAIATTGSSGSTVNLTTNCPAPPATPTGNANLQNYILYDITQAATVGSVSSCATSGTAATLAATAAITVASSDILQFQSPQGVDSAICPNGICFGNAKQIDVVPANAAVTITGIGTYSGTSATLTLSSRPASWIVGTKVLVTGMYPNEYNGYVTLTAVGTNTITYTCCTIAAQQSYSDPKAVHPDAPVIYGQAVIPYWFGSPTYGTWNSGISSLQMNGTAIDMSTLQLIGPATTLSTASQPYVQGLTFNNSALIDRSGQNGPIWGYWNVGNLSQIFAQTGGPRVGNLEDVYYNAYNPVAGATLVRNVSGISAWKALNIANNFRYNTGVFSLNVNMSVADQGYTGIQKVRYPTPGLFQGAVSRLTPNPADNVSSTPCTSAVTTSSNCMPAVASTPVFQGQLGSPSQVITSASGGSGTNVILTMASTASYNNNTQYWVWGSSNSAMNKKWSITVSSGTTITLTGSSAVGSPGIVAGATTIAPGETTFAIWTSGGGGFLINYSGVFLTGNCAGDTLLAAGVPSSTLLNNIVNQSYQSSSQTITGAGGGGASNATITMASTTNFVTGALYTISGNSNSSFNKSWTVTVTNGTTLTLQASTGIGAPGANGTVASGSTYTVFLADNWTSSGTICPGGLAIGDPMFGYLYAHADFIQIQIGTQQQSSQLTDYNLYVQRSNSIQEGAAPFVQPGGGYLGPGTISSVGTLVTMSAPLTASTTASGVTSAGSSTIQLTAGGCTGVTNGLGAWNTSSTPNAYLGNVNSCNTGTDLLSLYGAIPIPIANTDGLSFGTAPLVGDVLNVGDGTVSTGQLQNRRVVRVSPTFPADGKVWIDYAFFPDLTGRKWYFAPTAASVACVACTSGGNSTPGYSAINGLAVGNYATVGQWASGIDNFVFLQHSYGYGVQLFDWDNLAATGSLQGVSIYDSAFGIGCPVTGCLNGAATSPRPVMSTHDSATTPSWTTLLTNGTNLAQGYTFDNNNYALINYASTVFSPGTNNTSLGTIVNDTNYSPVNGSLTTVMRGKAGTGVPIFPWTHDGAPLPSSGALIGAMQPVHPTFTPLHTYYVAASGGSDANPGTAISPWATPNHAVVCGDVIIAAAGSYSAFTTFGTVSNCPSTTGGIDGTGGIYFATLLCGGSDLGSGGCAIPSVNIAKNNWAVEGWNCNGGGTTRCYEANASASGTTIIHHVAFINDIAYNALQGYDTNDGALNHNVPGNGVDYFAVVGSIAQNAVQDNICLAAIDFVGPANYDSNAGTHLYANGVFSYSNHNTGCTNVPTNDKDNESFMFDTLDAHGYANQGVIENSIAFNSDRACIQFTEQSYSSAVPTLIAKNNTCFQNDVSTGADFLDGEINLQLAPSPSTWNITITDNIAFQPLATSSSGQRVNALTVGFHGITTFSNTSNFYKAALSGCVVAFCDPGFNTGANTSAELGTSQTYIDPAFTNTTDLLANQLGAPNCTGYETVTQCMGYAPGVLTTPSIISDLVPTATNIAGNGYQLPSATCAPNALYPSWLKGIVYLHWDGTSITQKSGLVTKPCGL